MTFFFPHALRSPWPFSLEGAWVRTLNRKKNDVQSIPGQMGHCLHEEIEEISPSRVNPSLKKGYPARGADPA